MEEIQHFKQAIAASAKRVAGLVAVAFIAVALVGLLTGCQDRYRYACQNPDNFASPECQKPKCLFTQQCPEYLVAPILEKQINAQQQQQPTTEPAPQR